MPLTPEAKVIYVHLAGFLARSYQTPSHSRYDIEEQWHAGLFDFLRNGPYSSGELLRLSTGFPFKHRQEAGVSPKTVQNYKIYRLDVLCSSKIPTYRYFSIKSACSGLASQSLAISCQCDTVSCTSSIICLCSRIPMFSPTFCRSAIVKLSCFPLSDSWWLFVHLPPGVYE